MYTAKTQFTLASAVAENILLVYVVISQQQTACFFRYMLLSISWYIDYHFMRSYPVFSTELSLTIVVLIC